MVKNYPVSWQVVQCRTIVLHVKFKRDWAILSLLFYGEKPKFRAPPSPEDAKKPQILSTFDPQLKTHQV